MQKSTFKSWMQDNFTERFLEDIATHGCINGYAGMIEYAETLELYAQFGEEIWEIVYKIAAEQGETVLQTLANFGDASCVVNRHMFENLMVWFAAERIADNLVNGDYA